MMHREVITKRKVPVITIGVLAITIILYINEYINMVNSLNINTKKILFISLVVLSVVIIIKLLSICGVSYKYSLIGDKLLVNKITSTVEKNVESIKIQDIAYIGSKKMLPREFKGLRYKRYICNRLQGNELICIYKVGKTYSKFIFQPSDKFIGKINKIIK